MGLDFDAAVAAVARERSGLVGDEIAATNDLLQIGEAGVEMTDGAGGEGCATGKSGQSAQSTVADRGTLILLQDLTGADGVDGNFAILSGGDGLLESDAAGVVFAIADDDKDAGDGLRFRMGGELVGGVGNGVPESGSTTRREQCGRPRRGLLLFFFSPVGFSSAFHRGGRRAFR